MKQKGIGLLLSIAAGQIPHIGPSGIDALSRGPLMQGKTPSQVQDAEQPFC